MNQKSKTNQNNLPKWFKQELPDMNFIRSRQKEFRQLNLNTVCESAKCPNINNCWNKNVATFMILGDICTRCCHFCAVTTGAPAGVDLLEPKNIANAIEKLGLKYVVITSVTRDDLPDLGSNQFYETVKETQKRMPRPRIEVLIPDFQNKDAAIKKVVDAKPDVISHNIETVKELYSEVRPQADYLGSLDVLRKVKSFDNNVLTKTGFMLGLGEKKEQVLNLINDIFSVGCDILTIGQYLSPSKTDRHLKVHEFIDLEEFNYYEQFAKDLGFKSVSSGPLVRSSFLAENNFNEIVNFKDN